MKNKKIWFWVGIWAAAIIAVGVIIYVFPSVAGLLDRSYVAKYGELEVSNDVSGYVVRNDIVYTAGKAGTVERKAKEGKLYKGQSTIVQISGEGAEEQDKDYKDLLKALGSEIVPTTGTTSHPGYVSYNVDDMIPLTLQSLEKMTKKGYDDLGRPKSRDTANGKVAEGDPVFRLTLNSEWYLIFYVDSATAKRYTEGRTVQLYQDGQEEAYTGTVKLVQSPKASSADGKSGDDSGEENTKIVIRVLTHLPEVLNTRQLDAKIVTADTEGVLLQSDSIVKKDGELGVVTKNKVGKLQFKRISIKADNGEQAAVYEDYYMDEEGNFVKTVSVYDEVVKSPSEKDIKNATLVVY